MHETGVSRICSSECLSAELTRRREHARQRPRKPRPRTKPSLDLAVRKEVRQRDGNRCRWCGRGDGSLHVHHVIYRSAGGCDEPCNLILLCERHHQEAHAAKHRWQPILLALLWITYVEGTLLTVVEVERRLVRDGMADSNTGTRWSTTTENPLGKQAI